MDTEQLQQKINELELMYYWLHQGYRTLEVRLAEALDQNIYLKTKLDQAKEHFSDEN